MLLRPNLVLVVLDDLVAADLTPERSPQWTDLCQAGVRLDRAYSMPVCSQSRACISWGQYGRSLGIIQAMSVENGPEPPGSEQALAELLALSGYSACKVGKWHLGRNIINPGLGPLGAANERGFNRWTAGSGDNLNAYREWERIEDYSASTETAYATTAQMVAAREWWDATPWPKYLELGLAAPHAPFHDPPEELLGGYKSNAIDVRRNRYERMIRSADWALGELRTFTGIENSVVCVVSDNGTPPQVPGPGQDPAKLKTTAYEGGCRVAMAWYGPAPLVVPQPPRDPLVHLVDVPVTLLDFAGEAAPSHWDGRSLCGVLAGLPSTVREHALIEAQLADGSTERGVASLTHKLIRHDGGLEELYHLASDPQELMPLDLQAPENQTVLQELRGVLDG